MQNTSASSTIESDVEKYIKPRLRLFMSVDIVGSTAIKQKPTDDGPVDAKEWLSLTLEFYHNFVHKLHKKWVSDRNHYTKESPTIWKVLGDEIIFVKLINSDHDLFYALNVFIDTIAAYRRALIQKGLDLKGAAWLAGFPFINQEYVLTEEIESGVTNDSVLGGPDINTKNFQELIKYYKLAEDKTGTEYNQRLDFLGPSIDTGFRVSSQASKRKFVLSVDLAWAFALLTGNFADNDDYSYPEHWVTRTFRYAGRINLKGVLNEEDYPIFWIDMLVGDKNYIPDKQLADFLKIEDERLGNKELDHANVKELSKAFLDIKRKLLIKPYIYRDSTEDGNVNALQSCPDHHIENIKKLREKILLEHKSQEVAAKNISEQSEEIGMDQSESNKLIDKAKGYSLGEES